MYTQEHTQLLNFRLLLYRYKTHRAMAAKEEVSSTTIDAKTEETPDNSTTEDAPTSLETIPEGNVARNGLQTAPKDKSKSMNLIRFHTVSFTYRQYI